MALMRLDRFAQVGVNGVWWVELWGTSEPLSLHIGARSKNS